MICFAFPLAHEAAPLLKLCTEKDSFTIDGLKCTVGNFGKRRVLIALIGMGEAQAADNAGTLLQHFRLKALILAGYGGALVPPLKIGQVLISSNFSSSSVLGFLRLLSGFDFANFCHAEEVAGTKEKRSLLASQTNAQVADMETEAVANVVGDSAIPFMAVRVISDAFTDELPTGALAAGFDASLGRATPFRLAGYLATHSHEFAPFKKFVQGLTLARHNLTQFLVQLNRELPAHW